MSNDLRSLTCLVTGANSGLGQATAQLLAQRGATVILVCRDAAKGEAARTAIRQATGNPRLDLLVADLASQTALRALAGEIQAKYLALHVLVNNAGAVFHQRTQTPDKIEASLALNHLAPFLLNHLLRDLLAHSGTPAAPARIINITTKPLDHAALYLDDWQFARRFYVGLQAYSEAKLANILTTHEMARRWHTYPLTVNSLHPGLFRSNLGGTANADLLKQLAGLAQAFLPTPEQAAARVVALATAPEFSARSGHYFGEKDEIHLPPAAQEAALMRRLWEMSAALVDQ